MSTLKRALPHAIIAVAGLLLGACLKRPGPSLGDLPSNRWIKVEPGGFTRCAHNTKFAFWVRRGTVNKLLFYFQGGGGCWDAKSCAKGSPLYNARLRRMNDPANRRGGIFAMDDPRNPFRDWHAVVVPSCTGDVYFGDNIKDYRRKDGTTVRIYHRGFVNGRAALDWAVRNVARPETVFLTGCSAGSAGSMFFSPHVIERYPGSPVVQLGDSLSFAWHRPGDFDAGYGAGKNLPDWILEGGFDPRRFRMSRFITAVARHYPDRVFAQFNTRADRVQARFYRALGGPRGGFPGSLRRMLARVHRTAPNFRSFTAAGGLHCVLPRPAFYRLRTAGHLVRDWVADLAAGKSVKNVRCPTCGDGTRASRRKALREGVLEARGPLLASRSHPPGELVRGSSLRTGNVVRPPARGILGLIPRTRSGQRSKGQVRRVLKRHAQQVRTCYERELIKNPDLGGKLILQMVIAASGRVRSAKVTSSTLDNDEVHRCLETRARQWLFPRSRGITVVRYPYNFRAVREKGPR